MGLFLASPDMPICRNFREACSGTGSAIIRRPMGGDPVQEFARSAASGLLHAPRRMESRFLYDAQGSELFDSITQQPEYYLTRTETAILAANAPRIRELTGPVGLVELGSGNATKTDILLHAWLDRARSTCYVPVDVSESALAAACSRINRTYPQARVIAVNSEYQDAFPLFAELSPTLVLFLGSTIGNFTVAETSRFLGSMAASLQPPDRFLVGIDLVKEAKLLEAAYNDAAGVTAEFTRNLFARMNRELGCSFELDSIEHVARYQADREQIETFAHFTRKQSVHLALLDRELVIPAGEMVQVEISRKFRLEKFLPYLEELGFVSEQVFTDDQGWFALLLLRRSSGHPVRRKERP